MSAKLDQLIAKALAENGYAYSAETQNQFRRFLELLQKWNQVFNLTAIRGAEDQVYLHLIDSLSILPYLQGQRCLDVGSGGGLPGLPLAIADSSRSWVLLDKSRKKTQFLVQVVAELGLKNVTVVCERCENFHPETGFDSIVSRAFGTINLFLASTQHLLAADGVFLAMKGIHPSDELAALPGGFSVLKVLPLNIQGLAAERHLIRIGRKEDS